MPIQGCEPHAAHVIFRKLSATWRPPRVPAKRRLQTRPSKVLGVVRCVKERLDTCCNAEQGFYEKTYWPPMALRTGLLRSSALQDDGLDAPCLLHTSDAADDLPRVDLGGRCYTTNTTA